MLPHKSVNTRNSSAMRELLAKLVYSLRPDQDFLLSNFFLFYQRHPKILFVSNIFVGKHLFLQNIRTCSLLFCFLPLYCCIFSKAKNASFTDKAFLHLWGETKYFFKLVFVSQPAQQQAQPIKTSFSPKNSSLTFYSIWASDWSEVEVGSAPWSKPLLSVKIMVKDPWFFFQPFWMWTK